MKIDYDVGDAVVYRGPPEGVTGLKSGLVIGSIHRCTRIYTWHDGSLATNIDTMPGSFEPLCFRKLPKADDYFTEYMRSMKPHKQPVDA